MNPLRGIGMPVPNTRRFNRYGTDTGLNVSFRQIPVADHSLPTGFVFDTGVLTEEELNLGF